jgi:hypothetical protein
LAEKDYLEFKRSHHYHQNQQHRRIGIEAELGYKLVKLIKGKEINCTASL